MINMAVGESTIDGALRNDDKHRAFYVEFSPYNHVNQDDPPLLMKNSGDTTLPSKNSCHGIYHPVYGVKMKVKADSVGQECHLHIDGHTASDRYPTADAFIFDPLLQ